MEKIEGPFKQGFPSELELNDLAGKICRKWTTVGLHLGIPQDVLDGIDVNERHDRPYKMLLRWRSTTDTDTPYCDLCRALCDEKVGLVNVAKQFCLEETTGVEMTAAEAQKTPSNYKVKPGCPSEQILEELGSEIHSHSVYSWKKLARRLEINEGKINSIDEQEKELSEKAYKMLLFWKQVNGRGATYEVLLKALTDKLVNRADLAKMYCCES